MTRQEKIDHIVLNVPNMAKFMYGMYFGEPVGMQMTIDNLRQFAKNNLEKMSDSDLEVLYEDIDGNEELTTPLHEKE